MERSEPALVPEWLKGGGGGGTLQHALHQDDKQRPQSHGIISENESPRYVPPRRLSSGAGAFPAGERPAYEKNGFSSGSRVYPHFSSRRSNNYDHLERTDRDIDKERGLGYRDLDGRWGQTGKIEQEFSRRHVVGNSVRSLENGDKRSENGSVSGFTGIVQKAMFERNFPTLGAQEKPTPVYSSLGNVTVLSPRHHWQRPGDPGNATSESWTSNLAEPLSNGVVPSLPALPAPSLNGPKMAEALVQNSPRVRTSPQASTESQRMELALKQSRQLVPMTPTIPNLKPKPKMVASITKPNTQLQNAALRPQQSPRAETGKLLFLKTGSTSPRPDSSTVIGNGKIPPGPTSLSSTVAPRKQKQLLDRRAVPIPPLTTSTGQDAANSIRPKDNGVSEDKRLAQNRSDFFNTLRKKAAGGGNSAEEKPDKNGNATAPDGTSKEQAGSASVQHSGDPSGNSTNGSSSSSSCCSKVAGANGVIEDNQYSRKDIVEEEEAAFLRSLGWKEDAEGGEGALTEEEISEFLEEQKKHLRSKTSSPLSNKRQSMLQNAVLGLRADCGFSSFSSGMTSTDTEPGSKSRVDHQA